VASGPLVFAIIVAAPVYFLNTWKRNSRTSTDVRRNNEYSEQMFCKIFAVVCCAAEMSARNRKINTYFAPSRLAKKKCVMDVSRRCVRISAAEINIMQILERRIVVMGYMCVCMDVWICVFVGTWKYMCVNCPFYTWKLEIMWTVL